MARRLLDAVLADFRETGHRYLRHLVNRRQTARRAGIPQEVAALDEEIHEHAIHQQIPRRWQLDFLFSHAGYESYGAGILPFWAAMLIHICVLEQYWETVLLGLRPENPCLLPGFHPDAELSSTAWLKDFRRTWATELNVRRS